MGFENISSLGTFGDYPNMYMTVTKKFANTSSFSIGSVGRYIDKKMLVSAMTGAEIFFSPTWSLLFDIVAYDDARYNTNAGIRIYGDSNTYFSLYVLNASRNNEDHDTYPAIATIGFTMNNFMQ